MSRRIALLSVAAVFLLMTAQAQGKVTDETDEEARSRIALELAAHFTAKLPHLLAPGAPAGPPPYPLQDYGKVR
jgi:hypothetical protein